MDAKEWFANKKIDMLDSLREMDIDIHDLQEFKFSETYRDPNDESLQWEICVICRSLK